MKLHSEIPEENLRDLELMSCATPPGPFVELGVYKGGSAQVLYRVAMAQNRNIYLFDTFQGMPFQFTGDVFGVGTFNDVNLKELQSAMPLATFCVGTFPDTMPTDLCDIAFVHVDCDQYKSCKDAIEKFWSRMQRGGIMAFDDYPNINSIKRAVDESGLDLKYSTNKIAYAVKS